MGENSSLASQGADQHLVARRYRGAWSIASVIAILFGWLFLLGSVLVPRTEGFLFVGVALCSCGFVMEFFLRSKPMKAE